MNNLRARRRRIDRYYLPMLLGLLLPLLNACSSAEDEYRGVEGAEIEQGEVESGGGDSQRITIAFYNVENLFDTFDDPETDDDEFTPRGLLKWDQERLDRKMEDIARVITSMDGNNGPSIIGFAEVENELVMSLLAENFLPEGRYRVVHEDSPDGRGIDVGVLYRTDVAEVRSHRLHRVNLGAGQRTTRSILEVEFVRDDIPFTVLVNHWPSRSGGELESRWKRGRAAGVARGVVDSLLSVDPQRDIVLIGDFNDSPLDPSIAETLGATGTGDGSSLYNMGYQMAEVDTFGTYLYQTDWDLLDQIIVSPGLFDDRGLTISDREQTIFAPDFLRDDHPSQKGRRPPRRTYIRRTLYIGGTSDHFPVYARFRWR